MEKFRFIQKYSCSIPVTFVESYDVTAESLEDARKMLEEVTDLQDVEKDGVVEFVECEQIIDDFFVNYATRYIEEILDPEGEEV